ncbi:MAG: class I SAM-dependent methyltransferase [Spirochaetaceae bacterium]
MECKTFSIKPKDEEAERVPCALCGYEPPVLLWDNRDYSFSKCPRCGLIYQYPLPKQEELLDRYDREYFTYELENERAFFDLMEKTLEDVHFYRDLEDAESPGKNGRPEEKGIFLDIGCATGMLLEKMKKRGWKEKGVEVCAPSAEYGIERRGVDIHTGTLESAEFPSEIFDVVHASHLIEHLCDPVTFLSELARVLRPGGRALITTPNAAGLQARLLGKKWRSAIADHMHLFTRRTLKEMLENQGFEVEYWKSWGGIAAGLAPKPLKKIMDLSAKQFGWGDVMVFRARKPGA